jgi:hypothetical protein
MHAYPSGLRRGLRPFGCWGRGFESRSGHVCLCLYVVLSCVGRGLCDGLITRPEESYLVSLCDQETPKGALCSRWEPTGK